MARRLAQYFRELARTNLKIAQELEACSERDLSALRPKTCNSDSAPDRIDDPVLDDFRAMTAQADASRVVLRWIRELNDAYPEPRVLVADCLVSELARRFAHLLVKYGFLNGSQGTAELTAAGRMSLIRAASAERSVYKFLSNQVGHRDVDEPHVLLLAMLRSHFRERKR